MTVFVEPRKPLPPARHWDIPRQHEVDIVFQDTVIATVLLQEISLREYEEAEAKGGEEAVKALIESAVLTPKQQIPMRYSSTVAQQISRFFSEPMLPTTPDGSTESTEEASPPTPEAAG